MKETTKNIDISISRIADRLRGRSPRPLGRHSFFSVMIPLCRGAGGELSLLFEVRSSKLRHQPGDICFPGGKIEEGETPLECALREFAEETGIAASSLDVLGQFDTLYGFADYTLYTFVAELPAAALSSGRLTSLCRIRRACTRLTSSRTSAPSRSRRRGFPAATDGAKARTSSRSTAGRTA